MLVVYVDGLQEFIDVELQVSVFLKHLFAVGARRVLHEPIVDALNMEDVIAVQHSAHGVISDCV